MGRKIQLDTELFCPHPYVKKGAKECDETSCDFPPESKRQSDHGADWKCSVCGMKITYDYWD